MVLREQQEEALRAQVALKNRENAGDPAAAAAAAAAGLAPAPTVTVGAGAGAGIGDSTATDEHKVPDEGAEEEEATRYGSKIVVIHPGSQNLRLGVASDALPKSIPNVIARRADKAESEVEERRPKRVKLDSDGDHSMSDGDEESVGPVERDKEV